MINMTNITIEQATECKPIHFVKEITKTGNSHCIIISPKKLNHLGAKEGDEVIVTMVKFEPKIYTFDRQNWKYN